MKVGDLATSSGMTKALELAAIPKTKEKAKKTKKGAKDSAQDTAGKDGKEDGQAASQG